VLLRRYREIIDDWPAFLDALDRTLPPVIWTNTLRTTPEELRARLAGDGIETEPIGWYPGAFRLPADARPGKTLPYLTGHYHVQEEVSLLPVTLLDPRPGERILDLCAAPGNKTVQTAVRMGNRGTVIAVEKSRHRIGLVLRNTERLGVTCTAAFLANAGNLPREVGLFDRVLADVPCNCEGTTRKNPEVIWREEMPPGMMSGNQLAILRKAVKKCRPGGRIVYSTCTYAPEENEAVVDAVLGEAEPGSLRLLPARVDGFRTAPGITSWQGERWHPTLERTMRVYPHLNDTGGFFVAVLEKAA
jgi:NOL1/NOP2/sun family putative RNA methylase